MSNQTDDTTAPWTPFDGVTSVMTDGLKRVDGVYDEVARRQRHLLEQSGTAVTEMARMGTDSIGVAMKLHEEWFRVMRGATEWAGQMATGAIKR